MKKFCAILLMVSMVSLSIYNVYGGSVEDALEKANEELKGLGLDFELYSLSTSRGFINAELATKGISVEGSPEKQVFVYGRNDSASSQLNMSPLFDKGQHRALGFAVTDRPFPNPNSMTQTAT